MNMYYTIDEKLPPPKKWIKCVINGVEENGVLIGVTEWAYCVSINDGIVLLSDNENCEYVFVWNEENYTHWQYREYI